MTVFQAHSNRSAEEREPAAPTPSTFRPDIEGLRAVAVLAVVLFHSAVPGISGGYVGVDIFFVISGFLITGLLWREAGSTGTVRLRNFYAARARRLLPASALVGVVTMIASIALLSGAQAKAAVVDGIASALYVGNVWFVLEGVNYFNASRGAPRSPFEHYWSLGVEEQFYLVWPALILGTAALARLLGRRTRAQAVASPRPYVIVLAVVVVLSLALSVAVSYILPTMAFFSLPTRAWQLGAGGLVALTALRWQGLSPRTAAITGWAGLALILLACVLLTPATLYPGFAAILPTLGAMLVIAAGCATPAGGCGRMLTGTVLRAVGRVSYSWYLWHWPLLIFAPLIVGHPLGLPGRLATAALSGLLALATLRLVENPLRFAPRIRASARAGLGLGAVATVIAVCAGLVLLRTVPPAVGRGTSASPLTITATDLDGALAQVRAALTAAAERTAVPDNLTPALADAVPDEKHYSFGDCVRGFFDGSDATCVTGDPSSPTSVALAGDSHAAMWIPALKELANQRHWRLEVMAKAGCPPIEVPIANPVRRFAQRVQQCGQWRGQLLARLRAAPPDLIVISLWRQYDTDAWLSGVTPYSRAWNDGITGFLGALRGTGSKLLVLGPIPAPGTAVPICLAGHLDDVPACTPDRSSAVNEPGISAEAAATTAGGGHYADLTDVFCTAQRCPVIVGKNLVFIDWSHLTVEYARLLAPVIGAFAERTLDGHAPA